MSFNISMSGLKAFKQELGVHANNIANASTVGFKGARAEFSAVYNGKEGGGVSISGITQNHDTSGSILGTGRSLDVAIAGSGFFVTKDSNGQQQYSRSGMFGMNANGSMVDSNGNLLQGYSVDGNGNIMQGTITDINVSNSALNARATDNVDFLANLDANAEDIDMVATPFDPDDPKTYTNSYTTPVYDSLGNEHIVTQYFVKTGPNTYEVIAQTDGATIGNTTLNFDTDGSLLAGGNFNASFPAPGADPVSIDFNLDKITQFGSSFTVTDNSANGYTSGEFNSVYIEEDGSVIATYSNGQTQVQGQIILASFPSNAGLQAVSGTSWQQTYSSGAPIFGTAGVGVLGNLVGGAVESSNVDTTESMIGLMETQQNYQANTKSIQAQNSIAQTLMQVF
ncbi:flagellar hook protein FlgE (plasmid) [Vibrio breoganii]|uniref:Flagellar hook protein FlgE n=2 Tax=Vibrio TaxID=662 RepID=A0AAN0XZ40_9VIBR|nr:flagellar hook protein FlgE [Vibrio breoganii]ANO35290.1 flagellar hook protein FlgE [Vibrio breoganii]